jgi:queuosine precursor transporter
MTSPHGAAPWRARHVLPALVAIHIALIIASNYLVQLPFELFGLHTTWGAFTFPLIFVATDLTVRLLGQAAARRVIARVMLPALLASYVVSVLFFEGAFSGWGSLGEFNGFVFRIALASFLAYALGQWLDIAVFGRLQQVRAWWVAPAASTVLGSLLDTALFFSVAFFRSSDPFMAEHWVEIAAVDYATKLVVSLLCFLPLYAVLLNALARHFQPAPASTTASALH